MFEIGVTDSSCCAKCSESEFKIGKPANKYDPLHVKRTVL